MSKTVFNVYTTKKKMLLVQINLTSQIIFSWQRLQSWGEYQKKKTLYHFEVIIQFWHLRVLKNMTKKSNKMERKIEISQKQQPQLLMTYKNIWTYEEFTTKLRRKKKKSDGTYVLFCVDMYTHSYSFKYESVSFISVTFATVGGRRWF